MGGNLAHEEWDGEGGVMVSQGVSRISIFVLLFCRVGVLATATLGSVFIMGCGRGDHGVQTYPASSTGAPGMENREKAYVVSVSERKTPLLRGLLSTRDLKVTVDSQNKKIKIAGTVSLSKSSPNNGDLAPNKESDIELEGTFTKQGTGVLFPLNQQEEPQTLRVRAMITCLDKNAGDCKNLVADIFVNDPTSGTYHLTQVQSKNDNPTKLASLPNATLPQTGVSDKPSSDSEGFPDLYVGNAYTNFDKLFDENSDSISTINSTSDLKRPTDQAIGQPDNGQLNNASDLFERMTTTQAPIDLPKKSRARFYGSYELVEFVIQMGFLSQKFDLGHKLQVSDLSQKTGGRLSNSLHVSHQNGMDVDVGYLTRDRASTDEDFPHVVAGQTLRADFPTGEMLKYFHSLFLTSNDGIDRIFINQVIKDGFCKQAKDPNFLASIDNQASLPETLRRLRVWEGHSDHFHLRLKCTKYHPRCRQMTEPPQGTGCK